MATFADRVAYQADAAAAFVPVRARLAQADVMNPWVTHIGSAAFDPLHGPGAGFSPW